MTDWKPPSDWKCPHSGLPLHGDGEGLPGTQSCDVCDCFGNPVPDPPDPRDELAAVIRAEYDKRPADKYPTEFALAEALSEKFEFRARAASTPNTHGGEVSYPVNPQPYGFSWGPAWVRRTAEIDGTVVLTIGTATGQQVDAYVSRTGRSLRVFKKGKGELRAAAPPQPLDDERTP